jgi:hypothetical protein
MSESEFKKALNDGLIDKYVSDGTIAIRNFKPKAEVAPVVETPAVEAPVAETTLSPRAESFKNFYLDSYFGIPKRNTKQRSAKLQYISGQQSSLDPEDREAAKAALEEIKRRESETTTKPETTVTEKKSKSELEKEFNALNKQYVADDKLLTEATKNNQDTTDIESRMNDTQGKMSEISNQIESPIEAPKAESTLSKKDQEELDFVSGEIEATESAIVDAEEQIEIEKGNFKEEKERIQKEKAKVRASKMSKDEKADKLEELDAELSDIKDDHDDLIEQYRDDIKQEKADLKRYNNRKAKIQQKAPAQPIAEVKAEPTEAKEAEAEYKKEEPTEQPKTRQDYIKIAKESNGDYAIVLTRGGDEIVYRKNRRTGRWQGLTGKGEFVDVNDEMNRKANDAVNYTRKDKKVVMMSTVKNGITSYDEFVYDFNNNEWKKRSEDGYLYGIGPELAAKAEQLFLKENPKRAAKNKAVDKAKQDTENAIGDQMTPELQETIDSKEFADGVEVAEAPTAQEDKKKPKKGKRHMATQRRGAAIGFAAGLIEQLEKVFPNISRMSGGLIVDQSAFDNIANQLGASPYAAALMHDGIIYLNPSVANGNTAFEEYAHVYLMAIERINPSLFNRGMSLVTQSPEYLDEVMNDPEYAYIHENKPYDDLSKSQQKKVQFEALSKMIADRAEKVFDSRAKAPFVSWLKELWQSIARMFKLGSAKLDLSRTNLNDYVSAIAKDLNRNSPISMINKDQLQSLMEGDLVTVTVSKSVASPQSAASHWLRTNFYANKGLDETEAYRLKNARRQIQVWQNRVKDTVNDLNKAVKDYVKATGRDKVDVLLDVNQSLSDPVKRADWFSSDAQANALIKPVVQSMRDQIDMLQAKLAASGLFNDDLTATITGNNDVYINTSYYAFSGRNYDGEWMSLFSQTEKDQILDWVYNGSYQTASKVNYTVSPTGGVTARFQNGFGVETDDISFNNMKEFKTFIKDNVALKLNGSPIKITKVKFNTNGGSIDFYAPMDISKSGIKFDSNEALIYGHLNEIVKDKDALSNFIHTQKSLTSMSAKSALKKKRNLDQTYRLFLREIKDPATNYANTIAKQSEILFKGMVEQAIIDSGYLSSRKSAGNNTVLISDPGSRLRGYYVSPELNRLLNDRTPNLLDILSVRGKGMKMPLGVDTLMSTATGLSSLTKAYLTVLSIGSNAANYISGYFQLAKTGNLPLGMVSAMRALEQGFSNTEVTSKENIVSAFLNTVPTIVRSLSVLANNSALYNKGMTIDVNGNQVQIVGGLSAEQKQYFNVNDFSQLTSQQKARVLLEELISTGVIGTNIDTEMLRELTETAFDQTIPDELVKSKMQKIINKTKMFAGDTWEAASASYAFSDSMFKAIMYLNEKQKNWETYGSIMAQEGVASEVIEQEMREKTAIDVRKQMPTYDRSPDFIKALSKFPLIGTFIQFDFQSKVNDKNIIADVFKMATDSVKYKNKYPKEAKKLANRSMIKFGAIVGTSTMSLAVYNLVNAFISGYDDDDDEAVRSILPEYRGYNLMLHMDGNKKGLHTYLDITRIDPQTLYTKYYRALTEDGFDAMADEILKPYYTQDIFIGGLAQTLMNINQYGDYDKKIENMNFLEKLQFFVSERILPSGVVGQVSKLFDAMEGGEVSPGIEKNPFYEFTNMYFGLKPRTLNIGDEYGKKIKFDHFAKIQDEHKIEFNSAKKDLEKIQDQYNRGVISKEKLEEAQAELEEKRLIANKKVAKEMESARALTNKMRVLGYTDDEIRQILVDSDATRYIINILLDPSLNAEFDSEGKIGAGRPGRASKSENLDLDLDLDLDLSL